MAKQQQQGMDDWMTPSMGEEQAGKAGKGLPQLKLKDGETAHVRFVSKRKEAAINWKAHNDHPRIISPKTNDPNAKCYFTELAEKTGDKTLYPKWRCYILCLVRRLGTFDKNRPELMRDAGNKLMVWDFTMTTKADIRQILENRFDITESPNGILDFDCMITRKGSGMDDTAYFPVFAKKATPLTAEEKAYLAEMNYDLDKEFVPSSYEEVASWFGGSRSAAAPARSSSPATRAAAPAPGAGSFGPPPAAAPAVGAEDTLF